MAKLYRHYKGNLYEYLSDIEAGRVAGSITFARQCAEEEFQKMMKKATKEFKDKTKR